MTDEESHRIRLCESVGEVMQRKQPPKGLEEQPTDPASPATQSKFAAVSAIFNRYTAVTALIGLAVTTVGYVHFLDARVEGLVAERMKPYEFLLSGIALNQTEDWEQSVVMLQEASKRIDRKSSSAEVINLLDDALLYAIANSDSPGKHSPDFRRIQKRLDEDLQETGWRVHHVGWFYLRIGRVEEAAKHFQRALQLDDAEQERKQGAYALRGLMFTALAQGDSSQAMEYLVLASERNPLDADLELIAKDIPSWPAEGWLKQLEGMYGERFTKATRDLEAQLATRNRKERAHDAAAQADT